MSAAISRLQLHPDWIQLEQAAFVHPSGRLLRVREKESLDLLMRTVERGQPLADATAGLTERDASAFLQLARGLIEKGVLMRSLPATVPWLSVNKYARMRSQIISLAGMLRSTERALLVQKRLAGARVALIGAGGSGAMLALELIAAGVGAVRIVDDDHVELENLGRQFLYRERDIGIAKVAALGEILRDYDSEARVEQMAMRVRDRDSAVTAVRDCNIAVVTADDPWPDLLRWVGAAARQADCSLLPTFYSSYGPLLRPSASPCIECVLAWMDAGVRGVLGSSSRPLSSSDAARRLGGIGIGIAAAATAYAREVIGYISGVFSVRSLKGSVNVEDGQWKINTDCMSFRCAFCDADAQQ
jgi:hypothetical protein